MVEITVTGKDIRIGDEISIFGAWKGIVVTHVMDTVFFASGVPFGRTDDPFVIRRVESA